MNERIDQLAEQATSSRIQYDPKTMMTERIQEFDKEKFAELIVRECVDIACKHMELNEGTDYNIGEQIKQHFGVE